MVLVLLFIASRSVFVTISDSISNTANTTSHATHTLVTASMFFVGLLSCVRFSGALLVYLLPMKNDAFRLCLRRRRLVQEFVGGVFFAGLSPMPLVLFSDKNKTWGFPLYWVLLLVSYKLSKITSLVTLRKYWGYSEEMISRTKDLKSKRYSRSRVDAYTDGVLAISATLIILDIGSCEQGGSVGMVSSCQDIDVVSYLNDRRSQLSAYIVSFVLICAMLWTRHASMWKHVKQCGILLHFLNTQCCCFIALLPYSIELMMSYDESDEQRRHAVIFWLCNVLLISLNILAMGAYIMSSYHTLPRDSDEHPKKSSTKKWKLRSGFLLPFWTICGILAAIFDTDGESAWRTAIGFQIVAHPLSQAFVFWRYMKAYEAEEEEGWREVASGDSDDEEGNKGDRESWSGRAIEDSYLTQSLVDKRERSQGQGGHR